MIEIVYYRDDHKLTAKGHAKSAEKGKDLVCSAVSILVYTLAGNVQQMCENRNRCRRPEIKLDEGDAVVSCSPVHGMHAVTTLVFDAVCNGFEIIAKQYPQFVSYKIVQG